MSAEAQFKTTKKELALEEELSFLHRVFAWNVDQPVNLTQIELHEIGLSTDLFARAREVIHKHGIHIVSHCPTQRCMDAHLAYNM